MRLFGKLFGKGSGAERVVVSPVAGISVPLEETGDPAFAGGNLGRGLGINPATNTVCAPVAGTVIATIDTWHALGILSDDGAEVLVHVGIDTVKMGGDGFTGHVEKGQRVAPGEPLVTFDREKIAAAGYSDIVIMTVTNSDEFPGLAVSAGGPVQAGDAVITLG